MVPLVIEMVVLDGYGAIWSLLHLKQLLNEAFHLILKFHHSKCEISTSRRPISMGSLDPHSSCSHISGITRFMSTGINICVTVYFIIYYVLTTMKILNNMY